MKRVAGSNEDSAITKTILVVTGLCLSTCMVASTIAFVRWVL